MLNETNEADLLRRMWAGDEQVFTMLYQRHQGAVFRFALHMTGRAGIAEEVTQEVFMMLMRGRGQYDPERGSLSGFLYGVARNCVRRILERERPYMTSLDDPANTRDDQPLAAGDILRDLTRIERVDSLRQAILKLPAPYREVVVLCELHEMNYADVAATLGCPVGTVRSRLHRARTLLAWKLRAGERCPA